MCIYKLTSAYLNSTDIDWVCVLFPIDEGFELLPHVVEMIVVPLARNIMDNIVLRGVIKGPSV